VDIIHRRIRDENRLPVTFEAPYYWRRGWAIKSLGVCAFFGSGSKKCQDESAFADAAPLELGLLLVEQQPAFSYNTAKHSNSMVQ
jgi:hypothetical protein